MSDLDRAIRAELARDYFFCVPDEVVERTLSGQAHDGPAIHMQRPESFCPHADPDVVERLAGIKAARLSGGDR